VPYVPDEGLQSYRVPLRRGRARPLYSGFPSRKG